MKYWVYKESQILGPFDKEGVSGLPGVDEGTLVCEGDPAAGSWVPAASAGLVSPGAGTLGADDLPNSSGLLDQLLIDSSGLVRDDDFPGALAQDLFTDPEYKSSFGDVLSAGGPAGEAEARRSRDKVSELTVQLEHLYRHIAQLEAGHTDLARRLAEKEMQLRSGVHAAPAPAPEAFVPPPAAPVPEAPPAPARTFLSPPPPAPPKAPAAAPEPAAPSDWGQTAGGGAPLPAIFGDAQPPTKVVVPGVPGLIPPAPPPPDLPALPAEAAAPAPLPPLPEIPKPAPVEPPKTQGFGKPKSFKVVPTAKSFKTVGASDAPPPAAAGPAPTFSVPPEPVAAAAPPPPPPPVAAPPVPTPAPVPVMPPPAPVAAFSAPPPPPVTAPPAPVIVAPPVPTPAPIDFAPPAVSPFAPVDATPAPPPNTMSRSATPVPDLGATEAAPSFGTSEPPMTMARRGGAAAPEADSASDEAARFAKPAPPETAAPKPARNNKKFLIAGGVLLTLLLGVAVIFMRQPKDDLKQMAALDDGAPRVGAVPDDAASAPPMVKPRVATPEPAPTPPPGPSAEHEAAINAVKDFPLDGGRGTVGKWLQYAYTASPGSGTEEWNASTTPDGSGTLVEYRFVPGPGGAGRGALYLFEVDSIGLVIGKSIEARQMLAGTPPSEAATPAPKKKAPAKKKPAKRRAVIEEPKEVPQLPLPDSGELRPPAEDDGSFGSDTINSGI